MSIWFQNFKMILRKEFFRYSTLPLMFQSCFVALLNACRLLTLTNKTCNVDPPLTSDNENRWRELLSNGYQWNREAPCSYKIGWGHPASGHVPNRSFKSRFISNVGEIASIPKYVSASTNRHHLAAAFRLERTLFQWLPEQNNSWITLSGNHVKFYAVNLFK